MNENLDDKVEKERRKPKWEVSYGSETELRAMERRMSYSGPKDYVDIPNFINLWADAVKKADPDGSKARELANKYREKYEKEGKI